MYLLLDDKNVKSVFSFLGGYIPYYGSEWSFAQIRNQPKDTIIGFVYEGG